MKKLMSLPAIFLSLVFLLPGCEKDPPKTPLNPTIDASSDFSGVPYGKSVTITLILKNILLVTSELDTFHISETSKTIQISTPNLTATTTYHFLATGENGKKAVANVTIMVDPPIKPSLSLYVDNDTIFRGKSPDFVKITWNSNTDSTSSPELLGVKGKSGTVTVSPTETTTYHFVSKNDGLSISDSVRITVKDPPPPPPLTDEELLALAPWKKIKWEIQNYPPNGDWENIDIWPCLSDDVFTYYLYPKNCVMDAGEVLCDGETVRVTVSQNWSLTGSTLMPGNAHIELLTKDILVWTYDGTRILPDGTAPTKIRETFKHP